jgi:predicted transcriptional regulator
MRIDSFKAMTTGRLRTIEAGATVRTAATALSDDAGLVVVCGDGEEAVGVIRKTDLVRHLARAGSAGAGAAGLMTRDFVSCRPEDEIRTVWQAMTVRRLQNVPVLGMNSRPLGILDIRDAMRVILETEQLEEQALANYIAGVGYR